MPRIYVIDPVQWRGLYGKRYAVLFANVVGFTWVLRRGYCIGYSCLFS